MMTEGIDDSSQTPSIVIADRPNHFRSRSNSSIERRIRIVYHHHHARRAASQGFRAEILVLGRLVRDPKIGFANGELSYNCAIWSIDAKQFARSKCGFIEVDGLGSFSN